MFAFFSQVAKWPTRVARIWCQGSQNQVPGRPALGPEAAEIRWLGGAAATLPPHPPTGANPPPPVGPLKSA